MPQNKNWTVRDVEPVTGIKAWMLGWLVDQGIVLLDEAERGDVNAKGRGKMRRFSGPTIMELVVTGQCHRLGLEWADAYLAAQRFTATARACPSCREAREPGKPFQGGETYLVASPGRDGAIVHVCGQPGSDALGSILLNAGHEIDKAFQDGSEGVAIVNVGRVYDRVRAELGER